MSTDPTDRPPDTGERLPDNGVAAYARAHPGWHAQFPAGEPVYALPAEVINLLARPCARALRLLDDAAAATERGFTRLCDDCRVVGVWEGEPISYRLLTLPLPLPTADEMRAAGWTRAQAAAAPRVVDRVEGVWNRLRGVAGWLAGEPAFRADVAALRIAWGALPELDRVGPVGRLDRRWAGRSAAAAGFAARLVAALDRWGLESFATWDLPVPQGPLLPNPLPAGSPATPAHGVHVFVPVHYPLRGDDDFLRLVRDAQRAEAGRLGLDLSFGGVPHHEVYAQLFRLAHLERSILGRFPGRRPRGVVGHIEAAAAAHLGVTTDRVRRLRKGLARCLRGDRAAVRWLN